MRCVCATADRPAYKSLRPIRRRKARSFFAPNKPKSDNAVLQTMRGNAADRQFDETHF